MICNINHIGEKIFKDVSDCLEKAGLIMHGGSIVEATIIVATSSTKNKEDKRDPEMHQTKKGNQWYHGMKVHSGVDAGSGYVHTITGTAANVHDIIAGINDVDDVMNEWNSYVVEQRAHDLDEIIAEEKLKPEDTRKFMENAFRDGEIKISGTDIDRLMPPISRFGGGGRAKKKQVVIDKLKTFFEKYFGIGGQASFTEQEKKVIIYAFGRQQPLSMVAEPKMPYGEKS